MNSLTLVIITINPNWSHLKVPKGGCAPGAQVGAHRSVRIMPQPVYAKGARVAQCLGIDISYVELISDTNAT